MKKFIKLAALVVIGAGSTLALSSGVASADVQFYSPDEEACVPVDISQLSVGRGEFIVEEEEDPCIHSHEPPYDACVNIDGVQTQVPAGLVLSGGRCLVIVTTTTPVASQPAPPTTVAPVVAAAAVVPTTVPAVAAPVQLPATGLSMTQAAIATALMALGFGALLATRRAGAAKS